MIKITGITLLNPLIAIFVALIILKTCVKIAKETLNNLEDGTIPIEDIQIIKDAVNECPEIKGYKSIKTRKSGSNRDIVITLLCDCNMTLKQCHDICDSIEDKIKIKLPNTLITIHCEPFIE